jgi:DNA-binding NarL/FixJ family response regulator
MDHEGRRVAVLLDEQPVWLNAMASLLDRVGIESVETTTRPSHALELVSALDPDVFVASAQATEGELNGLACIRRVAEEHAHVKRVVLSQNSETKDIDAAFAAGADVYCLKTSHPEDLAAAIRQVLETSIYFLEVPRSRDATGAAGVAARRRSKPRSRTPVTHSQTETEAQAQAQADPESTKLTERELEILRLMADGFSNSQLARMLWLSEQTVKFHLSNVYRKLGVSNRTEAARWAQRNGLLSPSDSPEHEELSRRLGA